MDPRNTPDADADTVYRATDNEAWIGQVLDGRYRIVRRLGGGGMGAVFVAEQLTLHKEVAVKVVRPELTANAEVTARFAREAMAMAQFEHPHVASAIDYGTLPDGTAYFVMQLVDGRSLRSLLHEYGAMPWRKACAISAQIADALSAARASGIVHRDLKPDNILVEDREDGSSLVKILDFGIAQLDANANQPAVVEGALPGQTLTRVGTVMGTPGYMAPEQAVGDKVDHRADLYSLGVVIWECIAGRELWTGGDVMAVIMRQLKEDAPPLRSVTHDGSFPEDLELIVQALLARRPQERPEAAGDVRDALRALSLMPGGSWRVGPTTAPHDNKAPGFDALLFRARELWRGQPPKRRRAQIASVATVMGAIALVVAVERSETPPAASVAPAEAVNATTDAEANESSEPEAVRNREIEVARAAHGTDTVVETGTSTQAHARQEPLANAGSKVLTLPAIPATLKKDVNLLLRGERLRARRAAGRRLLKSKRLTELPEYLQAVAQLEASAGCRTRRAAINKLADLGDRRALPSLERYHGASRTGCGFLGLADCYRCIRRDLASAMAKIPGE